MDAVDIIAFINRWALRLICAAIAIGAVKLVWRWANG